MKKGPSGRWIAWSLLFGKDDFYLEVQNHGIPEEKVVRTVFKRWSQEYGLKLVATNDYHYIDPVTQRHRKSSSVFLRAVPSMTRRISVSIIMSFI